ncbi:hypothetical protein QQ045_029375 [Rhodiola kirilowii]
MFEVMPDLGEASMDEVASPLSSMHSDDKKLQNDATEGLDPDDDEEFDSDSGMGSDDFDLLEVGGEPGTEFCQVGDQTCSVPLELYDLSDLAEVLSLDVWNECLSEDERFSLCKYLPDMDHATFMRTLKDLLSGSNMYFGNPVSKFFNMLKGGLCEPSVALRRQGLKFFQKKQYYHFLRNYQNNMVSSFLEIKEVWSYCQGQAVEDKIKFLKDTRKQKSLSLENVRNKGLESDSPGKDDEPRERIWSQRMMYRNGEQSKSHYSGYVTSPSLEFSNHNGLMNPKGFPKLLGTRQKNKSGYESRLAFLVEDQMQDRNDTSRTDDANSRRDRSLFNPELASKKNKADIKAQRSELYRKEKYPEMFLQSSQGASLTGFYFKDDRNDGRKKEKFGKRSPISNMNSYGNSFLPTRETSRNNDTESDSSDLGREGAYGHRLKKLDHVQPVEAYDRIVDSKADVDENSIRHHKKRKTGSVSPFKAATSSKKSFNLNDQTHLTRVENCTSKTKKTRKANAIKDDSYHLFRNLESRTLSYDHAMNSNGLTTQSCRLGNISSSNEFVVMEEDDAIPEARGLGEDGVRNGSNKGMLGCTSVKKKSKGKKGAKKVGKFDDSQPDELNVTNSGIMQPSDTFATKMEMMTVEPDLTPQKKTFTLITPTVDSSFMFSVMHLLSAVRIALITPYLEDTIVMQHGTQEAQSGISGEVSNGIHSKENMEGSNSCRPVQACVPTFSLQEIINRVRLNPGDPCILETPEPLQDLVRGVLKIFSSKLAPLGAKGWKPIAKYERSTKSWSWIGPLTHTSSDPETIEEIISPEAWGLPHRMLVKLVDAFAIWLKNSQETLREIGSLPPPPASLMQFNIDAKDRLKDLRAQKSLSTISPSTEEVREYFRREEYLRYSIPDRAFSYTAADGKKSTVAPLRRGGGKPSAKARDHFMLKSDRPPHVTILCLVRDAAARLPGSIGTRADVCTLIRDSQYVSEDVTDTQVTHILSGALDRLHYEQDPCVRFEQERKLWVYLHRDRDEEDFDEDGTLSTKKWKKPKKEAVDQVTDMVTDFVAEGQTGQVDESPQLDLVAAQSIHQELFIDNNSKLDGAF